MSRRIPVKALEQFAKEYDLTHVVLLGYDKDGADHVATWAHTADACSATADAGNRLKTAIGWPERLHSEPSSLKKANAEIERLQKALQRAANTALCFNRGTPLTKEWDNKADRDWWVKGWMAEAESK